MEDQSVFNPNNTTTVSTILSGGQTNNADQEYVIQCIKEVCHRGDSLQKYQRMIEKKFSPEFYTKCENFVEEVKRSVERKKFTNTSVVNLNYLAHQIGVSDSAVKYLVEHFTDKFNEEEKLKRGWECAFCGRKEIEVRMLIQGISANICDRCVEQAFVIIKEKLG